MSRKIEIEKYRRHYESDCQWQLKKLFIERFFDNFQEERLLCLAQCFVNIQTMGCRYSFKIMNQIQEMSKELEPDIQESINSSIKKQYHQNTQSNKTEIKPKEAKQLKIETEQISTNRKLKLISKTHLVSNQDIQVKQTPKPKIQILTRENSNQTQIGNSNQTTQAISYKNALTSSNSNKQIKLSKVVQSPSVPASTSELAPAASTLPIPFGLSPNFKESGRNALLKMIKCENKNSNDPLSILMGSGPSVLNNSLKSEDSKFLRLSKINKLRDVMRSIKNTDDQNFDLVQAFDDSCLKNNVEIKYNQSLENDLYFGELFIETFRLVKETNKKKKKCKYNSYKKAFEILISQSELAVKMAKEETFEYELYAIDTDLNFGTDYTKKNINDLNLMLKSMILPKENEQNGLNLNESKESQYEISEENDQEKKSPLSSKKEKIKKNLGTFLLFIPSDNLTEAINVDNLDNFIHDRNAIQILNQSCSKSNCKLEFDIKNKGECDESLQKATSSDQVEANFENDLSVRNEIRNFKCKCLINGIRISSAYSVSKTDSKRNSALKAIRSLAKIFPVMKETNYQQLNNQTSADKSNTKFLKISNNELFGHLIPPSIFETPLNSLESCSNMANFSNQSFGEKLLKKMGWKGEGHGLGRTEQGILKPVEFIDMNRSRFGFGYNYHFCDGYDDELRELDCLEAVSSLSLNQIETVQNKAQEEKEKPKKKIKIHQFINNVRQLLNDFVQSETEKDLVFDKDLSIEDRKIIHKEAQRYGLKTRSEGNGQERFIVVRKKKTSNEILTSVLKHGGELNKFSIISHGNFIE